MRNRAPFDACYALAKKTRPDIGRTNVQITPEGMDDYGKLLNVSFIYRNKMDDSAKDCMRTAAEALKFPSSLRGTQTGTIMFNPCWDPARWTSGLQPRVRQSSRRATVAI